MQIINTAIKDNASHRSGDDMFGSCIRLEIDSLLPLPEKPIEIAACNSGTFNFGTVSFETPAEYTITGIVNGQTITQIWSDAVTATGCNKETFSGGTANNYMTDCRTNPDYPGDFFSWCAVARYGNTLCPFPWRVPSTQDFATLCMIIGLNTAKTNTDQWGDYWNNSNAVAVRDKLINASWGGTYGGYGMGAMGRQGSLGYYWSQSENAADKSYALYVLLDGIIRPQYIDTKDRAFALRCVK
jgi:uncharacterized protein (TIGR02145 family)